MLITSDSRALLNKAGRFLDPIIVVTAPQSGFWTPNGRHRLEAMRRLGAKSISALVVADREVAWQILALEANNVTILPRGRTALVNLANVSIEVLAVRCRREMQLLPR